MVTGSTRIWQMGSIRSARSFRRAATTTSKIDTGARMFLRVTGPRPRNSDALECAAAVAMDFRAEDLAGRRVGGEPRGEVEGRPEVAPLELDDRAAMHSEPKQRKQ